MIDQLYDKAVERFIKHFGSSKVIEPVNTQSIDMEIWDKSGLMSIKNSKRIDTGNPRELVFEADIHGKIEDLEKAVEDDWGRKVTIRDRKNNTNNL